jgi:fibronectin type 3 domain-containing protein
MKSIIAIILVLFLSQAFAQSTNSMQAKGRAYGDSISIRFAPTSFLLWQHTIKAGVTIERFTITKNGSFTTNKERKVLHKALKPLPEMQWKPLLDRDEFAGVYAAAAYSKSFNVQGSPTAPGNLSDQITLNENRFSFALYAADMSLTTAVAAGLLITDKNVIKGEKYVYKIFPSTSLKGVKIDTGYVFIGPDEVSPLPSPRELKIEWGNKRAILNWDIRYDKGVYTTYEVERSSDGKSFKKTHESPIVNLVKEDKEKYRFYWVDSLPYNDSYFYYRIRGVNSFGEKGPYCDTIKGMPQEPINIPLPGVYYAKAEKAGIRIKWNYPDSLNESIKGFKILRANNIQDKNPELISAVLPGSSREFLDAQPKRKSFYYVQALDEKSRPATSFPLLGHIIDSIPPAAPKEMSGSIDSTGILRIHWKPVLEEDMMGYRVFFANRKEDEFTQLTNRAIADTFFVDTVSVNVLTKSMFVKLVAVDENYNPSVFSKVLEVKRPDVIPPQSPQFNSLRSVEKGIEINWNNSPSKDVVLHVLYKRKQGETTWTTIAVVDTAQRKNSYVDEAVTKGGLYEYLMIAVDDSKLESEPSKIIPVAFKDNGKRPAVEKLRATSDLEKGTVTLSWNYEDKTVTKFFVYRAEKGQGQRFYSKVDMALYFEDKNVKAGTTYVYKVCAVYASGLQSEFSKEVEVKW